MEYSIARKLTTSHSPNAERKEPGTKWPRVSLHVRDSQKDARPGCVAGSQGGGYIGEELGKVTGMDMVGGGAQSPELGGGFLSVFLRTVQFLASGFTSKGGKESWCLLSLVLLGKDTQRSPKPHAGTHGTQIH